MIFENENSFGRAVSRVLSSPTMSRERIICLSSQYPKPIPAERKSGAGSSGASYLALHPMGFSVPPRLLLERWALTPPFHPCRQPKPPAVCFLWHFPSKGFCLSPACIPALRQGYAASRPTVLGLSSPGLRRKRFSALPKPGQEYAAGVGKSNCLKTQTPNDEIPKEWLNPKSQSE